MYVILQNTEGAINDQKMQAASLIKLYIMGAVYEDYDSLSTTYGKETLDNNLNSMITVSDNDAANKLVNCLEAVMTQPEWRVSINSARIMDTPTLPWDVSFLQIIPMEIITPL